MKAWLKPIATIFVLALLPFSAAAQSTEAQPAAAKSTEGFYASIGGMYALPYDSDGSYEEGDFRLTGTVPLDGGPSFVAAVGYEMKSGLRGEIELGYRSTSWDKYEDLDLTFQGGSIASGDLEIGGDLDTISLMANGIMVLDGFWGVRPYIGLGIGFAQHEAEEEAFAITIGDAVYAFEATSEDDTVLAYQAMLGIAYPFSEKVEARLGYRYFGTEDPDFDGAEYEYGSHSVEVGILFRF